MNITITMTKTARERYAREGLRDLPALIVYLNETGNYLGTVTEVFVERDPEYRISGLD